MVEEVRSGVFFTAPSDLPRGRYASSREDVRRVQRERLMIAVTELMAAGGYRSIGVRDIAGRARVSAASFYDCFADKDACVFAAYDRFIEVLLQAVAGPLESPQDWSVTVAEVIGAYVRTLQSDLVVARAFQVEMDALGRPARDARRAALTGMAVLLKQRREDIWPTHTPVGLDAYTGSVYAVRQLASDALDERTSPDLHALAVEATPWVTRALAQP